MMDLTSILSDPELGGDSFSVIRETRKGLYGSAELISREIIPDLTGCVQPASPQDIVLFPQEERSEEMLLILSSFAFSPGTPPGTDGTFVSPDIILYRSRHYRVVRVRDWSGSGGFHKAWAVRMKED